MFDINNERFIELYKTFENMEECSQITKLNEEVGELTVAFTKYEYGVGTKEDFIEELADSFILMCQLLYGNDVDMVELAKVVADKLIRTEKRINENYYEKHR